MTLDSIALWLGYGVMLVGGLTLVAGLLFFGGLTMAIIANKSLVALVRVYDMKTLRATMRQLEAEGKVRKKAGVKS